VASILKSGGALSMIKASIPRGWRLSPLCLFYR
jgi:hypothetical protein